MRAQKMDARQVTWLQQYQMKRRSVTPTCNFKRQGTAKTWRLHNIAAPCLGTERT